MLEILTLQMRCPFFESGNISKFIIPASDTFSLLPTYPNDWILDYRFHKFVNQIREEGKESKNMVYDPQLSTSRPNIDATEITQAFKIYLKTVLQESTINL